MERTRFEVRLTTSEAEGQWTERRHRQRRVVPVAERRRGPPAAGQDRVGRRAVACDAGAEDAGGGDGDAGSRAKTLIFDEVDAGIGGRVATVVGQKLASLGERFQVLCITHLPQIAACGRTPLPDREAGPGPADRDQRQRLDGDERVDEIARMMGGAAAGEKALASARELLDDDEGERRKRKAKVAAKAKAQIAKARGRQARQAMKYFIETYGCQMNVHDSERMAGLLEQSGYDRGRVRADADLVVINTCSVRERAEEKLYTRLGEIKEMGARARPRPDRRRRRLRRAAGRRAR